MAVCHEHQPYPTTALQGVSLFLSVDKEGKHRRNRPPEIPSSLGWSEESVATELFYGRCDEEWSSPCYLASVGRCGSESQPKWKSSAVELGAGVTNSMAGWLPR
ncbi:hypothetical protein BHE74_00008003 [Ensete ventricosum]|nr:hypothetical protein BHE74_00008003 [Ensete ventricosum]